MFTDTSPIPATLMPAPASTARAWLSRESLAHNVRQLRRYAPAAEHMAIVKADAYGHGLSLISQELVNLGYRWLGAAQLSEALHLRQQLDAWGVSREQVRVFSWILPQTDDHAIGQALKAGIDVSVSSVHDVERLEHLHLPARVHLKVDTGMSRAGVTAPVLDEVLGALVRARSAGVETVAIWSHFACADEADSSSRDYTLQQIARYEDACERAAHFGFTSLLRHLAATSGQIWYPQAHYDLVRDGIGMYGLTPNPERASSAELGFEPVLTLEADVILTKTVPADTAVSYGRTWTAAHETRLALVPLGYGDGIFRHASNQAQVLLGAGEQRVLASVVGRICMDQFVVEAPLPAAVVESAQPLRAVLFGNPQGDYAPGCPSADDWARASGTINYEIVTRLSPRIDRRWLPQS